MKTCAICGLKNADTEPTCLACGEASWLAAAPEPEPAPEPEVKSSRWSKGSK